MTEVVASTDQVGLQPKFSHAGLLTSAAVRNGILRMME
jgi:hypothetical protein